MTIFWQKLCDPSFAKKKTPWDVSPKQGISATCQCRTSEQSYRGWKLGQGQNVMVKVSNVETSGNLNGFPNINVSYIKLNPMLYLLCSLLIIIISIVTSIVISIEISIVIIIVVSTVISTNTHITYYIHI